MAKKTEPTPSENLRLTKENYDSLPDRKEPVQQQICITQQMAESIDVLIQGVEVGRKSGLYSFTDARTICNAIEILTPYRAGR